MTLTHLEVPGGQIKIWFKFVPREGWLPFDTEGLWAERLSSDTARIMNIALFQDGVAEGDVVHFTTRADGTHWATGRAAASGNVTVRILPVRGGPVPTPADVHDRLSEFGLGCESYSDELPLVAVTVPRNSPMPAIKALLMRGVTDGWWHWETGCSSPEWAAA